MILFVWKLDVYLNINVYLLDVEAHAETGFTRLRLEKDSYCKDKNNKQIGFGRNFLYFHIKFWFIYLDKRNLYAFDNTYFQQEFYLYFY